MAITTSASDANALLLNRGGGAKSGGAREGGDSFAQALDTQMQTPNRDAPRIRHEPKRAESEKDRVSSGDDKEPVKETKALEAKPASRKESRKSASADEPAGTATADQAAEPLSREAAAAQAEGEMAAMAAEGGGNFLPPATAAVATDEAGSPTTSTGTSAAATMTATGMARGDGRAAAPQELAEAAALEGEAMNGRAGETPAPMEADADTGGGASSGRNSDALLQAMRLGLGGAQAGAGEKADFAAALAGLREALPRVAESATPAPITTPIMGAPAAGGVATSAAPAALAVAVPLHQAGWDQAMGEKVVWMGRQGIQEAQIQLNPRDLGPVEVRVSVHQDQASVSFVAQNPAAREALEAALPKLREMLAESGLNLAQSDVSHQSPQQRQEGWGDGGTQGRGAGPGRSGGAEEETSVIAETRLPSLSAVDYYA